MQKTAPWALMVGQVVFGLALACDGSINGPQASGGDKGSGQETPGNPTPGTKIAEETCAPVSDPGESPLRALTRTEYVRTVRDLTGIDPEATNLLAPADRSVTTFERTSQNFSLEKRQIRGYLDVAEAAAKSMLAGADGRAKFLGCEPTGAAAATCLSSLATTFGRKAFRRALAVEEVTALVTLGGSVQGDANPYAGAALIIEAVLQSPKFLMHVELGVPAAKEQRRPLTGYERASRLSYLTLGTAPDDALLATAEKGGLDDPTQVEQVAKGLLEDPRVVTNLRSFFQQWLGIASLKDIPKDPVVYPMWTDALKQSMLEETTRLVEDFAWTKGKSFADVLTARHTFIDANLATLYGMPAPASGFQQTALDGSPRFGLLTQASWLAVMAGGAVTPIRRGKFIRSSLLCAAPIPLPPSVPELEAPAPGESARQLLERHRSDEKCAACHRYMDPVGFGLSRYDEVGAYREKDAAGVTIDESGVLTYDGNPNVRVPSVPEFSGPGELAAKLAESGAFPACAVEKLFEFALARPELNRCVSHPVKQAFASAGYDFRVALTALVRSDAFLFRRDPMQEGTQP